jgi:hypothetical protein
MFIHIITPILYNLITITILLFHNFKSPYFEIINYSDSKL